MDAEELQIHTQQLQNILVQKQTLTMQTKEIEKALEELKKQDDDVYKSLGPIVIKAKKEEIIKELEEGKEDIDLKIKTLEKQEKRIKDKINELQDGMKLPGQGG